MTPDDSVFKDFSIPKGVVHCSGGQWGHATIITEWHRERWGHLIPKGRTPIGYNVVIPNGFITYDHWKKGFRANTYNGIPEVGRPWDADDDIEAHEKGAHVYGFNLNTFSICLIGLDVFTKQQIICLVKQLRLAISQFGIEIDHLYGHYEYPGVTKPCPNLDMDIIRELVRNKGEAFELIRALKNVRDIKRSDSKSPVSSAIS
ncbi:MAG: hypothetical protein GTN64_00235 [Candidatus Latescibacteria bacterium]|nr:hypothetical protein [Candidatus Latescibacterota bacterium]NIO77047.1 hypothetical protein [Candidatus Latescibacterota bacterium]